MSEFAESLPGPRFDAINAVIDQVLQHPRAEFEAALVAIEGKNFGSFEENRRIAAIVQQTADRLRVSFACAKCGVSSRFHCYAGSTSKTGSFVFAHGKSTHGGGTSVPELTLYEETEES